MIVTVYIDESHTHGGSPFMILGGRVGTAAQFRQLDKLWPKALKRAGIEYLHSKEARNGSGQFRGRPDSERDKVIISLHALASHYSLFSFAVKLSQADYQEHYRPGPHPRRQPIDSMYGMCFRLALVDLPRRVKANVKSSDGVEVNFVLETGHRNCGDAVRIFNHAKETAPAELRDLLGRITLGNKREFPGLQAADAAALGTALAENQNAPLTQLKPGTTLAEARAIARYNSPAYRFEVTAAVLEEVRRNMLADEERRRTYWRTNRAHKA